MPESKLESMLVSLVLMMMDGRGGWESDADESEIVNGEQAAKYIEMGFDMVNIMNDVGALQGHVALAAKNALEGSGLAVRNQ